MRADTPLDYAVFQLSPRRSRCELFVSSEGNTEKLASGSVKPFVTHLKVAEEQFALAVPLIKLEVEKCLKGETWFSKGTLERFVRFVSTPEILELVNTFDAEVSQLEAARILYSQGVGDQRSGASGGNGTGIMASADGTKKELMRAIDVRLVAARQDLSMACARASAAGFNLDTVSDLQHFSDCFGAHRLHEACLKFISLCQKRSELINLWKPSVDDRVIRTSFGSDMSIDDPTEDNAESHSHNKTQNRHQLEPPKSTPTPTLQDINVKDVAKEQNPPEVSEEKNKEETLIGSSSASVSHLSRRLSVQDRINLFESKQKENSNSSGSKPVVGKPVELRRLSSDVSSASSLAEKAVLRRWSCASDMSIDLSGEKKDVESPLCTPSSTSSVSQSKVNIFSGVSEDKDQKPVNDSANSSNVEMWSGSVRDNDCKVVKEEGSEAWMNWKEQATDKVQAISLLGRAEPVGNDLGVSQENVEILLGGKDRNDGIKDQVGCETRSGVFSDPAKTGMKHWVAPQDQIATQSKTTEGQFVNRMEISGLRDQMVMHSRSRYSQRHSRSLSGQFETPLAQFKEIQCEVDADVLSLDQQHLKKDHSGVLKKKMHNSVSSSSENATKSQFRRDDNGDVHNSTKLGFSGTKVLESQESSSTNLTAAVEQGQRARQSKGNQELNDELKMKANELEKLFAEHKLRAPGEQSGSGRRSKPADMQAEQAVSLHYIKPAAQKIASAQLLEEYSVPEPTGSSSSRTQLLTTSLTKMVDYPGNNLRPNFSDDSRGNLYEIYMEKRDAKLREEWVSRRAEKEAKMKAMQDSLDLSREEMKAKFSGSVDRHDSVSSARRRAEKLRSFNSRSSLKWEQHADSIQSGEDEDCPELLLQKGHGQESLFSDAVDTSSRSTKSKKVFPNKSLSSSTPRTTASPAPRSAVKVPYSSSGRRRGQTENPLAQSVPNFSDLRKENAKPSSGVTKATTRSHVRNNVRSKITNDDSAAKEEKPRQSHSLTKTSLVSVESKDLSPLNSDSSILAPVKFDEEQSVYNKHSKRMESKPFLRRGDGVGPGTGASITKVMASVASETLKDEEFDALAAEVEDLVIVTREEQEEESETMVVEDANMDSGKPSVSQASDQSGISDSENGDSMRFLSQLNPSIAELPAVMPSTFHPGGLMQDSPGESPLSWNSRVHHPFSYPQETSDIDASVDSPIGSPASWNFHNLAQTEADAVRMRKKWGSAQKPSLVVSSSNHSRKDVTKGFKRLLKFGRRSRGTETLMDWISATTSEGDDDTEDGRDPANRSSEDLRKSRMGFSQGPSDDSFNESELFSEQVQALRSSIPAPPANFKFREDNMSGSSLKAPRSFFSLSTFRNKGSDSKPR